MYTVSYKTIYKGLFAVQYCEEQYFERSFATEREANKFGHEMAGRRDTKDVFIHSAVSGMSRRAH